MKYNWKMKTSIFSRIFGAIVFVSFVAITLVTILHVREHVNVFENSIVREKTTLLSILKEISEEEEDFVPETVLKQVGDSPDILFFWVLRPDGEIFFADDPDYKGMTVEDEFIGVSSIRFREADYRGRNIKVLAGPVEGLEEEEWTAVMGVSMAGATAFFIPAFSRAAVIFSLAVLVSIFLALKLTERIITPLLDLRKAIRKITKGDLSYRINIRTGDEVEEIGKEFNLMTEKLKETREELEEAKKILEIKVRARTKELEELAESLEDQVEARTEELERKVEELEKFHKLTVGREKKMIKLKKENKRLKKEIEKLKKENEQS